MLQNFLKFMYKNAYLLISSRPYSANNFLSETLFNEIPFALKESNKVVVIFLLSNRSSCFVLVNLYRASVSTILALMLDLRTDFLLPCKLIA